MPYNVRVYDYALSKQVRIYSNTINELSEIKKTAKNIYEKKEDKIKSEIVNSERNKTVSTNRTKQSIYEISRANTWEWFITLTFDRNKIDSSDYELVIKKISKWLNNLKNRYAPNLVYLLVPELHSDKKHYHFHGLISNCGNIEFIDSGVIHNGKKVYNINNFKYGFSTATKVEDCQKVSAYISKYVTKELEILIKGKRRYIASKNCKRANITEYAMTDDEIKTFLECVSDDITYMKTQDVPVANQRIKYIELKK